MMSEDMCYTDPHSEFNKMFVTYIMNRTWARTVEELGGNRGKPWFDVDNLWGRHGWLYIRMVCFERAAKEIKRHNWSRGYLRERFQEIGGMYFEKEING